MAGAARAALRGPADDEWQPPAWLLPHQRDAAARLAGALRVFGIALLGDAVGLGKTYVALAIASRYRTATVAVPASLRGQWSSVARETGQRPLIVSHEAVSRGACVPAAALIIVDEAHRFRNPATRRYDRLARDIGAAHVLLLTATPVVNGTRDLLELLRLGLPDHALAALGLPSLSAPERASTAVLMQAIRPLTVARTAGAVRLQHRLPVPVDGLVHQLPTIEPAGLSPVLRALARLRFPPLGPEQRPLLHHHLLLRLASSTDALAASLRRHRRYLDHAILAAGRGEQLSRRAALGYLRDGDTDQFELPFAGPDASRLSTRTLEGEQHRVDRLLGRVAACATDPKRVALVDALHGVAGRRVLVFTAARVTAFRIAAALRWQRVAVVTGTGARIASGVLPVDEVLARFAPQGQGRRPPPAALGVDVLVATDLASEGLNLQDATVLVHYDLPWNPLRLAQRLGRTVRLGGRHGQVDVWWFAPPAPIERALRVLERIAARADLQLALPVPVTSRVGQARVASSALEHREILAGDPGVPTRGHAVTEGDGSAVAVLRWESRGGPVREVLGLGGPDPEWRLLAPGRQLTSKDAPIPVGIVTALGHAVRERVRRADPHVTSLPARALARRVLELAREAGAARDRALLAVLDAVLDRLREGVAAGAERDLTGILANPGTGHLARWLLDHPIRHPGLRYPMLESLLVESRDTG